MGKQSASSKKCPCTSGLEYGRCCAPYHRGEREPPDCQALVRARFAAFAPGDGEYLVKTLHPDHELMGGDPAALAKELAAGARRLKYMRLAFLDVGSEDEGTARVTFEAGIFERGADRSFVEVSEFARHHGAWRYLRGDVSRPRR